MAGSNIICHTFVCHIIIANVDVEDGKLRELLIIICAIELFSFSTIPFLDGNSIAVLGKR